MIGCETTMAALQHCKLSYLSGGHKYHSLSAAPRALANCTGNLGLTRPPLHLSVRITYNNMKHIFCLLSGRHWYRTPRSFHLKDTLQDKVLCARLLTSAGRSAIYARPDKVDAIDSSIRHPSTAQVSPYEDNPDNGEWAKSQTNGPEHCLRIIHGFLALLLSSTIILSPSALAQGTLAASNVLPQPDGTHKVAREQRVPTRRQYDPVSDQEKEASEDFSARVARAVQALESGQKAQGEGDFTTALTYYDEVVQHNGDLALAAYARVGRAITLYEVGDRGEAILEMEDMSIDLKGYPEIHAALAAALYEEKHAIAPAEQQFTLATLLDKRYTNVQWVKDNKSWPPSLLHSLDNFLALR